MKTPGQNAKVKISSQDLRTPMNVILGFARLATRFLDKENSYFYKKIFNAALKLQQTLDRSMLLEDQDYRSTINTEKTITGSVLVVDDDLMNLEVARLLLKQMGLKVDIALDAVSALEAVTAKSYDVIFMDLQMPEIDGFIVTKVIRNKGLQNVPIIALTADISKETKSKCIKIGMTGYLTKPIVPDILYDTLKQYL